MNDTESLLIVILKLKILIRSLLRFSEQTDVNIDMNTDFYVTKIQNRRSLCKNFSFCYSDDDDDDVEKDSKIDFVNDD